MRGGTKGGSVSPQSSGGIKGGSNGNVQSQPQCLVIPSASPQSSGGIKGGQNVANNATAYEHSFKIGKQLMTKKKSVVAKLMGQEKGASIGGQEPKCISNDSLQPIQVRVVNTPTEVEKARPLIDKIHPWIELALTAILVLVTCKQYEISETQTKIISNQLSATHKQLRAYINFEGADSVIYEVGKPASINVRFRNVGNTPAREVRFYGALVLAWPIVNIQFGTDTTFASRSGLGPQTSFHFTFNSEETVTNDDIADLLSHDKQWYFSVKVAYTDIFGGRDSTSVAMIWDTNEGAWVIRQDMDADNNYAE